MSDIGDEPGSDDDSDSSPDEDKTIQFGNIPQDLSKMTLDDFFAYFGSVKQIGYHEDDGKFEGFGFAIFRTLKSATAAKERLPPGENCWKVYNTCRDPQAEPEEDVFESLNLTEEEQQEREERILREKLEKEAAIKKAEEEKAAKRAAALARMDERKRLKKLEEQRKREKEEAEAKRLADLKAAQEAAEALEPEEPCEVFCQKGGNVRQRARHGMKYDILSASFSPDSQQIATSSNDKSVRIWDVKTSLEFTVIEHTDYVRCVVWQNATHVCSGCDDKMIRIWRVVERPVITEEDGFCEHSFKQRDWIVCICLSPNGEIMCGVSRNQVLLHHLVKPRLVRRRSSVGSNLGERDGSKEIRGSSKQSHLSRRDSRRDSIPSVPPPPIKLHHDEQTFDASFAPDGEMLVTASGWECGYATIWDVASGDELLKIDHVDWVLTAKWSPFGRRILTTSRDKYFRVWDLPPSSQMRCGEELKQYKLDKEEEERERLEAEQNTRKLMISKRKQQQLQEAKEREELAAKIYATEVMKFGHENWTCAGGWTPDGKFVCSGSDLGNVHLVCIEGDERLKRGQELVCFKQEEPITCLEFGNQGRRVCVASKDGTTRIYGGLHHLWKSPKAIVN